MVKSKILVIDDDLKILRLIKNILEKNSYVVETRNSVEDINLCDFWYYYKYQYHSLASLYPVKSNQILWSHIG